MHPRRNTTSLASEHRDIADTALRVAVLLQAGVVPERAWEALASVGDPRASRVHEHLQRGSSVSAAMAEQGEAWNSLAAAWRIAHEVGAPVADVLRNMSASLRDHAEAADDVSVALAEPAMTAKVMLWLPLCGLLLGVLLGFDTLSVLTTNPLGIGCAVAGLALLVLARWWSGRLTAKAIGQQRSPGIRAELTAVALAGGVSLPRALALVEEVGLEESDAETREVIELSRQAGVPAIELLRSSASAARQRARTEARIRGARLSTALLIPLGVCTLPAFFLLGVAPMLLSIISGSNLTL